MCGVWIPLEDVQPDSGELVIYPGSHRLPWLTMKSIGCPKVKDNDWSTFNQTVVSKWRQLLQEGGFEKVLYRPSRGAILRWHENLMHGGSLRIDRSKTRRSIVIHTFAEGSVAFYDSTGMPGVVFPPG
jgi:ectoine hydroxylase-related dioxygenase (phytanoyl-CoA dioxygenase family)